MTTNQKSLLKIAIVLIISLSMLFVPFEALGAPINPMQARVVALFLFAALMWILEPIPIWTTSTLVIAIALLGISNQSLTFLRPDRYDKAEVSAIVQDAIGVGGAVSPELVRQIQDSVNARLTKKPTVNEQEVRMTLGFQIMDSSEKAEKSNDLAAAQQLRDAHHRLYSSEISARIHSLKFVNLMQQKTTMATFADPIIILFLGGFFLAAAATKYRLDINLARVMLRPFGTNPKYVMLGLMVVTALFSMFMSNTATAAMMLAILTPVLSLFGPNDRGRAAFALCIPVAANIGGIGTPIGTPPNAIALKAMQDMGLSITFGKWMLFGVPFVIVMLLVGWLILVKMFPIQQEELKLEVGGSFLKTPKAIVVYVTFAVTIALWCFSENFKLGLDSNTIAIIPIAIFAATKVITKDDLKSMSWDVLWLVAGGFALGVALQETGLAKDMIDAIPFGTWNPTVLMVGAGFICLFMATFMSHTATASLLMPILAGVAGAMVQSHSMDGAGAIGLLCSIAFASSLGMALPISTPPNALAYATGLVEQKGMAISGTILCLLGLFLTFVLMYFLQSIGFFAM